MTPFYRPFMLRLLLFLTLLFAGFNVAARALGATQPPSAALAGFVDGCADKPQPCWYGIVPVLTRHREVNLITESHDYTSQGEIYSGSLRIYATYRSALAADGCVFGVGFGPHNEVVDFQLEACHGVYLGDIIRLFGMDAVVGFAPGSKRSLIYATSEFQIHFLFSGRLRPFETMTGVEIYPLIVPFDTFSWHGFAPPQRYCRLEPGNPRCGAAG